MTKAAKKEKESTLDFVRLESDAGEIFLEANEWDPHLEDFRVATVSLVGKEASRVGILLQLMNLQTEEW